MARAEVNDVAAFFQLQPLRRNLLFFVLSIGALAPNIYLGVLVIQSLIRLNQPEERRAVFTQFSIAVLFAIVSILTPMISLRRLHRSRIRRSEKSANASVWTIFKVRNPFHQPYRESAYNLANIIDNANCYSNGEELAFDKVPLLTEKDKEYVRIVVEECMVVKKRDDDDGSVFFSERSTWLLIFSHLVLLGGILTAGTFSFGEIRDEQLTSDGKIGKVLSEWLSNYVLLIVGFLQIVTRGAWFRGFAGICAGATSTLKVHQRNAFVALYIVCSECEIEGLRKQSCYSKYPMKGNKWIAPPVNTAIIAAARGTQFFKVNHKNDEYNVQWLELDNWAPLASEEPPSLESPLRISPSAQGSTTKTVPMDYFEVRKVGSSSSL